MFELSTSLRVNVAVVAFGLLSPTTVIPDDTPSLLPESVSARLDAVTPETGLLKTIVTVSAFTQLTTLALANWPAPSGSS